MSLVQFIYCFLVKATLTLLFWGFVAQMFVEWIGG